MTYRSKHSKKRTEKKKKPHWIYSGDLCWFKTETRVYPALTDWRYSEQILRVMYPDEPVRYVKRTREGRGGKWVHHIEVLGLYYVYHGSINDFTKGGPTPREDPFN